MLTDANLVQKFSHVRRIWRFTWSQFGNEKWKCVSRACAGWSTWTNSWQFSPKMFAEKNPFSWHFDAGALHSADFGDQGIYEVIQITCINFILQFSGLSGNLHITFNNWSLGDLRAPISCWWSFNLTAGRFYLHVCPLKLLAWDGDSTIGLRTFSPLCVFKCLLKLPAWENA